jgi:transposase
MSGKFQTINRDTPYLLPPSIQDWLPEQHLARFVVDIVEQLDLSKLESCYGGGGKQPYHPALLLAMMFYGYATGVFSSRKLEQASHDSVAFRFITADSHPDHDTIATFRKRFLPELEGLFVQILVLASTMGLFKLGKVSLDGTKVKANASKHKALSWGYANKLEEQLRREVQELLRRAEQADAEDEMELDIPDELARREDRLAAIARAKEEIERRAKERYEAEKAEYEEKLKRRQEKESKTGKKAGGRIPKPPVEGPRDKDQVNFTDEESRIMPSTEGFVQAYNAQAAVDIDSHMIVENHITQQTNDKQQIEPALERLNEMADSLGKPEGLLADTGYFSENNVNRCVDEDITPYISGSRQRHNLSLEERLKLPLPLPCPEDADALSAMVHRLQTREGKAVYAQRKSTVETVFGIIKEVLGFRRFHLRGLNAAQGEWNLVCMAWNLKRMYALAG